MTTTDTLLGDNEPAPYEFVNPGGQSNLILVCDHASNRVPLRLYNLGLGEQELASHIGWDPGAAAVARNLSARLDAPLLLSNYSRLVIDCNRWPAAQDSIPEISAGIAIPGNTFLTEADILSRRMSLFEPYQAEITALMTKPVEQQRYLLSIHSFTPSWPGQDRPWSIGVCYRKDVELAQRWLSTLKGKIMEQLQGSEELVGDNEPYKVEEGSDYTLPLQGESRGIPSIMLELRQDKIQDEAGVQAWSELIADAWLSLQA